MTELQEPCGPHRCMAKRRAVVCPHPLCPNGTEAAELKEPDGTRLVRVICGGHWTWGEPADRLDCRYCAKEIAKDGEECPARADGICVPGDCDPWANLGVQEAMGEEMMRRHSDPCGSCGDAKALHIEGIGACVARSGLSDECKCQKWVPPLVAEVDRVNDRPRNPELYGCREGGQCEPIPSNALTGEWACHKCGLPRPAPPEEIAIKSHVGTYAFRCEGCGRPPDPEPPAESAQWEIQRYGDVATTWACDEHLGEVIVRFQRDARMETYTVRRRLDVVPF